MKPLADRVRPKSLDQVVGQEHLLAKEKVLFRILTSGKLNNMIFYGPPGTGKTTVANLAAQMTKKPFYKLNATNASVGDIKAIIAELNSLFNSPGVVLYLDEIQNFNKKQQQSLLEFMENGQITLIASTTENPYHYIYNALLSRSIVFEFKPLKKENILQALLRAGEILQQEMPLTWDLEALEYLAQVSGGDVRKALNSLEVGVYSASLGDKTHLSLEVALECAQKGLYFDKSGDNHYDILSAFQKSIRGSDPDAALHYLARLIKGGDIISICRRLMVIAAEDIGLAYPQAISIVKSCVDCALQLGFPEARIPLAQGVILLATAPKSNSVIEAIDRALQDLAEKEIGDIPLHLKDSHYQGAVNLKRGLEYKYPHQYPNNYVKQDYLPSSLKDSVYYLPGKNKMEENITKYWEKIKKEELAE